MYQPPNRAVLPYSVDDDQALETNDKETQQHFEEFFEDVYYELGNYGKVEELNVCDNIGPHLLGNVYVKFRYEEDAEKALRALTGRFYAGKPIVTEFSPVTDFREACCRQYDFNECTRGGECNFMHLKAVSPSLYKKLFGKHPRSRHARGGGGHDGYDRRHRSPSKSRSRSRSRSRDRHRSRSRSKDRHRRSRSRSRSRDRHRSRSRSRDRHHRSRSRSHSRDRHRRSSRHHRERERDRDDGSRSRSSSRSRKRERERDRESDKGRRSDAQESETAKRPRLDDAGQGSVGSQANLVPPEYGQAPQAYDQAPSHPGAEYAQPPQTYEGGAP